MEYPNQQTIKLQHIHQKESTSYHNPDTQKPFKPENVKSEQTTNHRPSQMHTKKPQTSNKSIKFQQIYNDQLIDNQIKLIQFKSIIAKQLPKMPKQYIVKILMDGVHRSIIAKSEDGNIVGGVCFRGFQKKNFIQVVFMVVETSYKGKGLGTKIINHLKNQIRKDQIQLILTYADNTAIQFFKKVGFQFTYETPQKTWHGYIKAYLQGTLMLCKVYGQLEYQGFKQMMARHKKILISKIKQKNIDFRYKTSSISQSKQNYNFNKEDKQSVVVKKVMIPGLSQARWSFQNQASIQKQRQFSYLLQQLQAISYLRKLIPNLYISLPKNQYQYKPPINWSTIEKMILNRKSFKDSYQLRQFILNIIDDYINLTGLKGQQQLKQKVDNIMKSLLLRQIDVKLENLIKEKDIRNGYNIHHKI